MLALFLHPCPGLDAGMLVLALRVRLLACLRSEGGAPLKHEIHLSKEARRARETPKNPRKMFRDTENCFCLRYFCTSWPGLDAGMCLLALGLRLLAWFRSEESAPQLGGSKACHEDVS